MLALVSKFSFSSLNICSFLLNAFSRSNEYISNSFVSSRKNAFEKLHTFWKEHKNTVTAIYKAKLGEVEFNRDIRKYKTSIEMYLYSDKISVGNTSFTVEAISARNIGYDE